MTRKERYDFVIQYFLAHAPQAETELVYHSPYELLVAVMLSAQCTDKRVNATTPALFARYPGLRELAGADPEELLGLIRSISYPNSKTRHLVEMARMVLRDFGGVIPMTVGDLVKLPGVGRKTANVVTSVIDNQPNMAVDTHVFRVAARIGLTLHATTPLASEKQLVAHIPQNLVHRAHHWLILHGRYICTARSPKCNICGIKSVCKYYSVHS